MYAITIRQLRQHRACDLDGRIALLTTHIGREVTADEEIPLVVWAEITPDLFCLIWALRCAPGGSALAAKFATAAFDITYEAAAKIAADGAMGVLLAEAQLVAAATDAARAAAEAAGEAAARTDTKVSAAMAMANDAAVAWLRAAPDGVREAVTAAQAEVYAKLRRAFLVLVS